MGWFQNLWINYFWASDKGNGPEALQQTVIYATIAVLLVPPIRHALERFAKRHVESIKAHAEAENAKIHEKIDASHKLMHHIITQHPGIDNHVPGLDPKYQPKKSPSDTPGTAEGVGIGRFVDSSPISTNPSRESRLK